MGVATALTAAISAGSSIIGGIQARREAGVQADIANRAARQAEIEAGERAQAAERETRKLRSKQLVGFLKSGVALEGTALDVLEETELLGRQDIEAIQRQGQAQAFQFRSQAQAAQLTGRERLLGGVGTGASSAFRAFQRDQELF